MRSTFFVLLSVLVHALCVAAIAISPSRISAPEGNEVEVLIGEPAEMPGVEEAPESFAQAAIPLPPKEPKTLTVAKASERKTKVVMAPMEKVSERKVVEKSKSLQITELPAKQKVAEVQEEALDPEIEDSAPSAQNSSDNFTAELIPVKESAPAGVEAADSDEETEASSQEAKGVDPSPISRSDVESGELAKGGATQAGAVSYLNLKQAQGNKSPNYPLQARKELRQGQVELLYRVTKEGRVTDVQIATSSGHKDLDQEAARAVAQFKFIPGQEGWARHPVAFALKGQAATLPSRLRSAQTE